MSSEEAIIHGYHQQEGHRIVKVEIISGHSLCKKDIFGASDPYVHVTLYKPKPNGKVDVEIASVDTKTKKRTLNPEWRETFLFRVKPRDNRLLFTVYDENRLTRDDFLGLVDIPINSAYVQNDGVSTQNDFREFHLRPRSSRSRVKGFLRLKLSYHGDEGQREENQDDTRTENDWEMVHGDSTTSSALPSGWEERQDNVGRTYYVNHADRTTQWQRPTCSSSVRNVEEASTSGPSPPSITESSLADNVSRLSLPDENGTAEVAEGDTGSVVGTEGTRSEDEGNRLFGTRRHFGDDPQQPQQQPQSTTSDQWNPVNEESPTSPQPDQEPTTDGPVTVPKTPEVTETDADENSGDARPSSSRTTRSRTHTRFNISALSEDLPAGWEVRIDSHTNRPYYVDHINRRTSWKRPNLEVTTSSSSSRSPRSTSTASSSHSTPSKNNLGPLPAGWEMKTTPDGRVFFVDHNRQHTSWEDPRLSSKTRSFKLHNSATDNIGSLPPGWEERVNKDGRIFYVDHNRQKTQWEDPRLLDPTIAGPVVPYSRDYKQKYEFFKNKLSKTTPRDMPNRFEMKIDRRTILNDSFRAIQRVKKPEYLKARLWIEFSREKGLDYGGVAREWFYLLSKEMFNPYYGLFEYSSTDVYTLQINPNSGFCNDEHQQWFRFIGRVAGMAVFHGKLLDAFFIRPFYKMMLAKPITLRDMESVDSEFYNSLKYILENDPEALDLDFTVSEELFGQTKSTELKPGGADIKLTEQNKREYIQLIIKWRFVSRVQVQMKSFLQGFNELIPGNLLKIFDESELELLMCGLGEVDVNDWRKNTNYKGDYHANDKVILWFWKAILSMDREVRTRFLQFVTGTSRVPMNGFSELWGSNGPQLFTIEKWGTPDKLPRAHTCFNRLDLPPYTSYEELRSKILVAVENTHGFEGVD